MTLDELKDYLKTVCLAHRDVKSFKYGSNFDISVDKKDDYPMIFLELPFLVDFDLETSTRLDTVQIAFNVLVNIAADNIDADFTAISYAKSIGDVIVEYVNEFADDFKIQQTTALSVREYTDDSVAGMRYDLIILLPRPCVDDWMDVFNF